MKEFHFTGMHPRPLVNQLQSREEKWYRYLASTVFRLTSRRTHRSKTNGISERPVRWIKEGTSAVLLQSGLDGKWWAESMECFSYLRNVQDLLSDGKTPHQRRFGEPFIGPVVPFFATVEITLPLLKTCPVRHESLPRNNPRLFIKQGVNLERRHLGRRHWRIGKDGRI